MSSHADLDDDDSVFSSPGPPKPPAPAPAVVRQSRGALGPSRSSRPDSLPDEDFSVSTLRTSRTVRTHRTGRTAMTGATTATRAAAREKEIDALFEDLLAQPGGGGGEGGDTGGGAADASVAASSFATLPKFASAGVPARRGSGLGGGGGGAAADGGSVGSDDSKAAKAKRAGLHNGNNGRGTTMRPSEGGPVSPLPSMKERASMGIGSGNGNDADSLAPKEIFLPEHEGHSQGQRPPNSPMNSKLYRARASTHRHRGRRGGNASAVASRGGGGGGRSVAESTLGTNGVSSILDSLGLGVGPSKKYSSSQSQHTYDGGKSKVGALDGYLGGDRGNDGDDNAEESKHDKKLRLRREERQVHLRAGVALLGLVGLLFAAVQLTAVAKHDRAVLNHMRGGPHNHRGYGDGGGVGSKLKRLGQFAKRGEAFEEGVDRPVHGGIKGLLGGKRGSGNHPGDMALNLVGAKGVPRQRDGPSDSLRKFRDAVDAEEEEKEMADPRRGVKRHYGDGGDGDDAGDEGEDQGDFLARGGDGGGSNNGAVADTHEAKDVLPPDALVAGGDNVPPPPPADGKRVNQKDLDALLKSMLPPSFAYLSDNASPDPDHLDVPLFWQVPRSGGSIVRKILEECLGSPSGGGTVLASEAGVADGHGDDKELAVVSLEDEHGHRHRYVNVDASTVAGLKRAKRLGLASSTLDELRGHSGHGTNFAIVTSHLHAAVDVFDQSPRKARAFTLLRHPVERAVSTYRNLKQSGHEAVSKMTLEEYAKSAYAENNWMVRFLSGKMDGDVSTEHLAVAKEVLRTKFVVGLLPNKDGSLERFERYFGWTYQDQAGWDCQRKIVNGEASSNESSKYFVKEGNQAWNLLLWQNKLDAKLYEYGHYLFGRQGEELFPELDHGKNK